MKNNTLFSAFVFSFSLVILVLLISPAAAQAKSYQPEISGSFESGDKLFTEPGLLVENKDETVDYYHYNKQWLRYRQKLDIGEYYYLKLRDRSNLHSNRVLRLCLESQATPQVTKRAHCVPSIQSRDSGLAASGG